MAPLREKVIAKIDLEPKISDLSFFRTQNFFGSKNVLGPRDFWDQKFLKTQIFFGHNFFRTQSFFPTSQINKELTLLRSTRKKQNF